MGNAYSSRNSNLGINCPCFKSAPTGTRAVWVNSLDVSMSNWKDDQTETWGVRYKVGKKLEHGCCFQLEARHDNNGVESIYFGLRDDDADITSAFTLDIKRVGSDYLHGGIEGIANSGVYKSCISVKQDYIIETTIVSYDNSYTDNFFVLQMKKKKNHANAYMVTMAHYYVTNFAGLSSAAKIYRSRGKGFIVEVKGPYKHPSDDIRAVIAETIRTGIWSPGAKSNHTKKEDNSSSLKSNEIIAQFVKYASNKGLINSNGVTKGSLNNSIFLGCNFDKWK